MRGLTMRWSVAVLLVVCLVAACGDSGQDDADTTLVSANSTSTEPTTTSTVAASTSTTSTVVVDTAEEPDVKPPGEGEPWDVLFFGFDDVFTRLPGQLFAEQLSAELGVEVRLFEPPGFDYVWATTLIEQLRGDRYPPLGDYVPPAEVIVLFSRPGESPGGEDEHIVEDFERCWWQPAAGVPPRTDLTGEYWAFYQQSLDVLYGELWDLRQHQPTLILTIDLYNPSLPEQRKSGIDQECIAWFESWREQIAIAAEAHGSVFVSLQDVFNGIDHQLDPTEADLIGTTEADPSASWFQSTPLGAAQHADALREASLEALNNP